MRLVLQSWGEKTFKFVSNKERQISLHKIAKLLYYMDTVSKVKRQMTSLLDS